MLRTLAQNKRIYGIVAEIIEKCCRDIPKWTSEGKEKIATIKEIIQEDKKRAVIKISGQEKSSLLTYEQAEKLIKDLLNLKQYYIYYIDNFREIDDGKNLLIEQYYLTEISYKLVNAIYSCYGYLNMKYEARIKLQLRIIKNEKIRNNSDIRKIYEAVKSMVCRMLNMDTLFEIIKYIIQHQDLLTDWERGAIWDFYSQFSKLKKIDSPQKIKKIIEIYLKVGEVVDGKPNKIINQTNSQSKEVIEFPGLGKQCAIL